MYKCHIGSCTPRHTIMESKKKKKKTSSRETGPLGKLATRERNWVASLFCDMEWGIFVGVDENPEARFCTESERG